MSEVVKQPRIYMIPGLGSNHEIYDDYMDMGYEAKAFDFIKPMRRESVESYARRFTELIDTDRPIVLMGTSFGGILVQEMSRHIEVAHLIVISSAKSRKELAWFARASKWMPLHLLLPGGGYLWIHKLFLNRRKKMYNTRLFKRMKRISDAAEPPFVRWGLHKVITWNGKPVDVPILHIHGDKDELFPYRNIGDAECIKGGRHIMILNRSRDIIPIIQRYLAQHYGR